MASMDAASAAVCRRAALASLVRAAAAVFPPSYEEAVSLRDQICGLLEAEITVAGDAGDDASVTAMRALRTAVGNAMTDRAANLSRLVTVSVQVPLPSLLHAYRQYGDISRANEIAAYADAADPNFLPTEFRARGT
jgi:prophage DNA circulation protein